MLVLRSSQRWRVAACSISSALLRLPPGCHLIASCWHYALNGRKRCLLRTTWRSHKSHLSAASPASRISRVRLVDTPAFRPLAGDGQRFANTFRSSAILLPNLEVRRYGGFDSTSGHNGRRTPARFDPGLCGVTKQSGSDYQSCANSKKEGDRPGERNSGNEQSIVRQAGGDIGPARRVSSRGAHSDSRRDEHQWRKDDKIFDRISMSAPLLFQPRAGQAAPPDLRWPLRPDPSSVV
jgi:hypothetical protein